jgi:hypothetical protein
VEQAVEVYKKNLLGSQSVKDYRVVVWGIERLVGYDEYGELWICQDCWEAAPDLSGSEQDN